jgi:hypothetical protein
MRDAGNFFKHLLFAAVAVATLIFGLAVPRTARAADRIVVFHAEGDGADAFADDVKDQLPKGLIAGDPKKFEGALTKAGHKGAMGKALDNTKQRDKLLEKVRKAADTAKADVVVILRVKKNKKDRTVTILVVDPKSPTLAREDEVTLPLKKGKDDSKGVVASVNSGLEKFGGAAATPEPPPKKDEPKVVKKDDEKKDDVVEKKDDEEEKPKKEEPPSPSDRKVGEAGTALFIVGAGVELGIRQFEYNQPITKNLRAYRVVGAPMLGLNLELYPLANSKGPLAGIGIIANYAQALALQSAAAGGAKVPTKWNRYLVGLRYRIGIGDKGMYVAPMIGFGGQAFTFSGLDDKTAKESPAARYSYIRLGIDGRIPLGPVAITAGLGYLLTSVPKDDLEVVSGRFPHVSVGGVDANIGLGIGVTKGLEARLSFNYSRFFYSMNPEPGEPYIAGGALDQLSSVHIGAAYVY